MKFQFVEYIVDRIVKWLKSIFFEIVRTLIIKLLNEIRIAIFRWFWTFTFYITNDFNSFKRLIKRCKKFQKMIITFNNVLSFINESVKMNEINNAWIIFRIIKSIHHMLNVFFVDSNDRRRFCQIYSFDLSQKILLKRLIYDEQLFQKKITNYRTW